MSRDLFRRTHHNSTERHTKFNRLWIVNVSLVGTVKIYVSLKHSLRTNIRTEVKKSPTPYYTLKRVSIGIDEGIGRRRL